MKMKTLYQTLENRENPDEIESDGPFPCNRNDAWLGPGYYFWDTFIELGHWWGKKSYNGNYMVCEAICNDDSNQFFDLAGGNMEHLKEFKEYAQILLKQYPNFTVSKIIEHMKRYSGAFFYAAIRVYAVGSSNCDEILSNNRVKFVLKYPSYLDMTPSIQVCIIDKKKINLRNYLIVYPEEYKQ